jgi:gas vesicle structural protein
MIAPAASTLNDRAGDGGDVDALRREVTLLEILDRVLDKGVVLSGDITLSVADVDLVYVGLRVLLSSVEAAERGRRGTVAAERAAQGE